LSTPAPPPLPRSPPPPPLPRLPAARQRSLRHPSRLFVAPLDLARHDLDPRGRAYPAAARDVLGDNGVGADRDVVAHGDPADQLAACREEDAVADRRHLGDAPLAGGAEGDAVQEDRLGADARMGADDDADAVRDAQPRADLSRRADVDAGREDV